MRSSPVLYLTLSISVLSACTTKDHILPMPEQDMQTVYRQHQQRLGRGQLFVQRALLRHPLEEEEAVLSKYVRTEKTLLEAHFKFLPNPTLYMFVAPHLAGESQVPIPGYLTQFKMWEQEHYALPGEISDMRSHFNKVRGD